MDVPDDDHGFDYHKYVDTYYRGSDKNIYYAVLNFPAMEADGITVKEFGFALSYSETFFFEEADVVSPRRLWRYEILINYTEKIFVSLFCSHFVVLFLVDSK